MTWVSYATLGLMIVTVISNWVTLWTLYRMRRGY